MWHGSLPYDVSPFSSHPQRIAHHPDAHQSPANGHLLCRFSKDHPGTMVHAPRSTVPPGDSGSNAAQVMAPAPYDSIVNPFSTKRNSPPHRIAIVCSIGHTGRCTVVPRPGDEIELCLGIKILSFIFRLEN